MLKHRQTHPKRYLKAPNMGPFWHLAARELARSAVLLAASYALALLGVLVVGGPSASESLMPDWLMALVTQITTVAA